MRRVLVSAAEPSGDLLGAELVQALQGHGSTQFIGLAGPRMRAAGVEAIAHTEDMTAMGVVEVVAQLPAIHRARRALQLALRSGVDAAIFIDAPDLHLPLGKLARKLGTTSIGYVSPQVWAWRPARVKTVSSAFDQLLCLFDFEPPLYPDLKTHWVGHPVIDRWKRRQTWDPNLFGLAPGSRPQEIERMLKPFIQAAEHIRILKPEARFRLVSPVIDCPLPNWIQHSSQMSDLAHARGVLTKSGTVTLELAVMGVPQVVAHRVHPMTHWLGRQLVQGINHIAMPNILANSGVVPEFIQHLDPVELADQVLALPEEQPVDLRPLGEPGAVQRAANVVWNTLEAA